MFLLCFVVMIDLINYRFKKDTQTNTAHLRAQTIDKALLIIQMLKHGECARGRMYRGGAHRAAASGCGR